MGNVTYDLETVRMGKDIEQSEVEVFSRAQYYQIPDDYNSFLSEISPETRRLTVTT